MNVTNPVRGIADTARWVAYFRAQESKRPDAVFRDPYAELLAGDLGFEIAGQLEQGTRHDWAWVARTYLFDQFISNEIERGADLVLNLAAGLDARPYRLAIPSGVHWIEVDLPEIVSYKEKILSGKKPVCTVERVALDLLDEQSRKALFEKLDNQFKRIVAVSEGLLVYFSPEQVVSLSSDLAGRKNFQSWIIDLASPGQLKLMQRTVGKQLSGAGAPFRFGPAEGAKFFAPQGWTPVEIRGLLQTAADLKRAPQELLALLPEPKGKFGNYPWTGVCWLGRA